MEATKPADLQGAIVSPAPIPQPPLAGTVPMSYTPFRFQPPPPPQLPPIAEPMPDLMRQYEHEAKMDEMRKKEVERKQKQRTGFLGSITNALEAGANIVEKTVMDAANQIDSSIRSSTYKQAQSNFLTRYRLDPNADRLWREYSCRCVNGKTFVSGQLYISDHYLCFFGQQSLPRPQKGQTRLTFMIPLVNIICWHRGRTLPAQDGTPASQAPAVQLTMEDHKQGPHDQRPDALLVYTNDSSLHTFYSYWHFEHCVNVLDHAWRAAFARTGPAPTPIPEGQVLPALKPLPPTGSGRTPDAPTWQSH